MKKNIDKELNIDSKTLYINLYKKISQIAAILLLPLFIISTIYLYTTNSNFNENEIIISTAKGERVNITLPDNSKVVLNAESQLSYSPKDFNKKKRSINFQGEAYFQITKQEGSAFFIDGVGLEVKVLGTTFNLNNRENDNIAELALEKGRVQITALKNRNEVIMDANQLALLNRSNGNIEIISSEDINDSSSWKQNEIIFRNVPFNDVIDKINQIYGVNIYFAHKGDTLDSFTGTLITNNLDETLEILETIYQISIIQQERRIYRIKK